MTQEGVLPAIHVVEYGNSVSGPYCARLLGDAGADILKVEPPQGDDSRRRGPFPDDIPDPERSGLYHCLNFNKRGITLDIRSQIGHQILLELLKNADVFVVNNDAPVLEELGLLQEHLRVANERLIVTTITPYGLTGPYRNFKGDDLTAVSLGGLAYATPGIPDMVHDPQTEPPLRANTYLSDIVAGIHATIATQAALMSQEFSGGSGCQVDVSQTEAVASILLWDLCHAAYLEPKRREPVVYGSMPNVYIPCADGYVAIVAFTERHWQVLLEMMGNPEWAQLEVFSDSAERARNWDALEPLILEWTMAHTGEEITRMSQKRGLPCIHAHKVSQTVDSEHMKARDFFLTLTDPAKGSFKVPGYPVHLERSPWRFRRPAPRLGQHNVEVLKEKLGYTNRDLALLRGAGVI